MKLSIIAPIYNAAAFMESMVRSVQAQEADDWELILVDDGSTDGSGELCDALAAADARIRVIHQPNSGAAAARNAGLAAARGAYIGFIDSDDAAKPGMFRKLLSSAELHRSDIVMGGYEKVHDDAHRDAVHIPFPEEVTGSHAIRKIAWSMAFWNGYWEGKQMPSVYGSVWPNLYRADFLRRYEIGFPAGVRIGEDLLFNLDAFRHAERVSVVDEPLYAYNVANASATRKQNRELWERYTQLLRLEAEKLTLQYGPSEELTYNLHRQAVNYAINVGEEQLCVFRRGREARRAIRALCGDEQLQTAAAYIAKHGRSLKERMQAILIKGRFAGLIQLWLTKSQP